MAAKNNLACGIKRFEISKLIFVYESVRRKCEHFLDKNLYLDKITSTSIANVKCK